MVRARTLRQRIELGADIAANRVYSVKPGDFVYNRLFAWKGSFAVAGAEIDGAYVSNEFPCFTTTATRLNPYFLFWYFRREHAWTEVLGLSTGATPTSRNRLKRVRVPGQWRFPCRRSRSSGGSVSPDLLWTTRDWASAVADLPADGPLPCRTALVPRGRVAHALRRELIRIDRADALVGTWFVAVGVAASEVLRAAGVHAAPGEDALSGCGCCGSSRAACRSSTSPSSCSGPRSAGTRPSRRRSRISRRPA